MKSLYFAPVPLVVDMPVARHPVTTEIFTHWRAFVFPDDDRNTNPSGDRVVEDAIVYEISERTATMTYSVEFLPHNVKIEVEDNESLIRAAMDAGVHINASCGGGGVCGKCRVLVEGGQVEGGISEHLSDEDQEKGYRLACMSEVVSDLVVRVPVESQIDTSRLNVQATSRHTAKEVYSNVDELREDGLFIPPVEKTYLELDPASAEDNQADVERIINHLRLNHDEHRLTMNLNLIRKVPDIIREGDFKVTATIVRPVRKDGKNEIANIEPFDTTERNFGIAVDIGTTTIYGQALDLHTGEVLGQHGEFNGQISYGEDVISRIIFAEKRGWSGNPKPESG